MTALSIIKDEGLIENSEKMGKILINGLTKLIKKDGIIKLVRGKGLWVGIVFDSLHPKLKKLSIYDFCGLLKEKGLLVKQTHDIIIRIAPPLIINESQINDVLKIFKEVVEMVETYYMQ
jgi:ornithine--oxo-acid transaminase